MHKILFIVTVGIIFISINFMFAIAQVPNSDEIKSVAQNWVKMIIEKDGKWGESKDATIIGIYEFTRQERNLGYFCPVAPVGFLILSMRKELAPVKAYSTTCNIDPDFDEGIVAFVKTGMERVLNAIERKTGEISVARTESIEKIIELNYRQSWENLIHNPFSVTIPINTNEIREIAQPGHFLLTTSWFQGDPYNRHCPEPKSGDDCSDPHCAVGCVATAGAQIMRYWCWPPYGSESPYNDPYNWTQMPDRIFAFSESSEINAVAELCYEVGKAIDMNYCAEGCASSAYLSGDGNSLEKAFHEKFRYRDSIEKVNREDNSANEWFELIKTQIDNNRPIPYEIPGHAVIVDGYRINEGVKEYHVNYGWGVTNPPGGNIWYALDEIFHGKPNEEYLLTKVRPEPSIGPSLESIYPLPLTSFPYRYFDMNATGSSKFLAGQNLQFLPNITVTCTENSNIIFYGLRGLPTVLFSRGDESKGVKITQGVIALYKNGSIKMY